MQRYFLPIEGGVPAVKLAVLERGAVVNGAQANVNTVTVHNGHEFASGDKFLVANDRFNVAVDRVYPVSSSTATSVTFSGDTASFSDKVVLVNLGADTVSQAVGGPYDLPSWPLPNWDAAAVTVYKDADGGTAYASSLVMPEAGSEFGWYADGRLVWCVVLDAANRPRRVYTDVSSAAVVARGTDLPATVTAIHCEADVATDITINVAKDNSCDTAAISTTYTESGGLQCATTMTSGTIDTDNDNYAAGDCMDLAVIDTTVSTRVTICVDYTFD